MALSPVEPFMGIFLIFPGKVGEQIIGLNVFTLGSWSPGGRMDGSENIRAENRTIKSFPCRNRRRAIFFRICIMVLIICENHKIAKFSKLKSLVKLKKSNPQFYLNKGSTIFPLIFSQISRRLSNCSGSASLKSLVSEGSSARL